MPTPIKLLQFSELRSTRGIKFSRQHLRRLEALKKFPRRVKVGDFHIAWVESEIDAYLKASAAARPD